MALLDRVATLVRANLNDLIDRAENPEKMLKQVILDMENQFMQVKTQVAIALADLHILKKKRDDNFVLHNEWTSKAELAVGKQDDQLARAALERALNYQQLGEGYDRQVKHQETQVEALKAALKKLELKLEEARGKVEMLIARHRRTRAISRAADVQLTPQGENRNFQRLETKVTHEEALGRAKNEVLGDDIDGRLHALEREQKIDSLLEEIKRNKRMLSA